MSDLGRRVATALVLAPVFLAALFLLPAPLFALFLGLILLLGVWEWGDLCGLDGIRRVVWLALVTALAAAVYGFAWLGGAIVAGVVFWVAAAVAVLVYPRGRNVWRLGAVRRLAGLFVLVPAWAALAALHELPRGPWLVLWTMLMVWATDIGGYFAGRAFGRRKLAPAVSPGKTLEGLGGGVLAAVAVSVVMVLAAGWDADRLPLVLAVTLVVVAAAVFGDLFESLVKRVAGVKDSGTLLPGHGGVLDRVDAVLAAAPVSALLLGILGTAQPA